MRPGSASRFAFKAKAGPTADPKARLKTRSVSRLVLVATLASQALVFAAAAAPAGAAPVVALPAVATGTITEFRPAGISQTATSDPLGITTGPDGNLWFTEQSHGRIGKMTPGHVVTEFPSLSGNGAPTAITAGSDGALWFIDQGNNAIGRITTSGSVMEFPVPTPNAFSPNVQPTGITSGPDGNIWFTEQDTKAAIGRIIVGSPGAGAVTASPSSVTFANQNVGTSGPATVVTLTNGTTAMVHVNSAATSGANAGDFQLSNNSCPGTNLPARSTCQVSVTFRPTAAGARSATLTFNDTAGSQTVSLSGQATEVSMCDTGLIAVLLRLLGLLPPCS